jgi:hypothetical protein
MSNPFSYSSITNFGKVTLPSVEGWGSSLNILKDPPKSIHTRRRNKVGSTSSIIEDIDAATDRACEAIRVYARGTNPAVSVMYSNMGSCAGGVEKSSSVGSGYTEASLPYKIMQGGEFRPPILTQEMLLPLSRLPRTATCMTGRPGFADYSKRVMDCGTAETTRQVKNTMITLNVNSQKSEKRISPMEKPYEVKYNIQNPVHTSATSNINNRTKYVNNTKAGTNENNYTKICLNVAANTAKNSHANFKPGVTNNLKSRERNVPLSSWSGVVLGKPTVEPYNRTYKLGQYTQRGSMHGVANKPFVYAA